MEYLYYREEKLKYVFKILNLQNKEVAEKLEMRRDMVSNIQSYHQGRLKKYYLYAICKAYNIPMEIFEDESINTKEQIYNILKNRKDIFHRNPKLLNTLKGIWYLYSYPSNPALAKVWETKTTIYEDYSVEDMHENKGKLFIGKNQSIILKESSNSKNITSITFDNSRVAYGKFLFSRVSKSNGINKEIFNFGFFSRDKIDLDKATEILGEVKTVQLKIDHNLLERINNHIEIVG
jgi:transcriptional regulator with XRE-family HTH domain